MEREQLREDLARWISVNGALNIPLKKLKRKVLGFGVRGTKSLDCMDDVSHPLRLLLLGFETFCGVGEREHVDALQFFCEVFVENVLIYMGFKKVIRKCVHENIENLIPNKASISYN